jgi:hypothetical protein
MYAAKSKLSSGGASLVPNKELFALVPKEEELSNKSS